MRMNARLDVRVLWRRCFIGCGGCSGAAAEGDECAGERAERREPATGDRGGEDADVDRGIRFRYSMRCELDWDDSRWSISRAMGSGTTRQLFPEPKTGEPVPRGANVLLRVDGGATIQKECGSRRWTARSMAAVCRLCG